MKEKRSFSKGQQFKYAKWKYLFQYSNSIFRIRPFLYFHIEFL